MTPPPTTADPSPNAFVAVELPSPGEWPGDLATGAVLGLDSEGWACGWVSDGTNGDRPFIFSPLVTDGAPRGTMSVLPIGTYASGRANALVVRGSDRTIVGTVYNAAGTHSEAVYWTWSGAAWQMTQIFVGSGDPSEATGVDADDTDTWISGHQKAIQSGTRWNSFRHRVDDTTVMHSATLENFSYDVNPVGDCVGGRYVNTTSTDVRAFNWGPSGVQSLNPGGYDASAALAINKWADQTMDVFVDVVGWATEETTGITSAVLWRDEGLGSVLVFSPITGTTVNAMATDINDSREVVGTLFGATQQDPLEAFIWTFDPGTGGGAGHELSEITKFLQYDSGNLITEANAINDAGWIGGAMQEHDMTNAVPCLLVPFDVNSNDLPDYREIIDDPTEDDGGGDGIAGNWVPDSFEGMRVGLYPGAMSPSFAQTQNTVQNMYATRMHLNLAQVFGIVHDEQYVDGPDLKSRFGCAVNVHGSGDEGDGNPLNNQGREIIVMIRSSGIGAEAPLSDDYDFLPPIPVDGYPDLQHDDVLEDLAIFAYRQAHCIDFVQLGNEWLTGPGRYYLRADELQCSDAFIGGLLRDDVPGDCYVEALEVIMGWWHEQYEAIQNASALAGRPLRFATGAIHPGTVNTGTDGVLTGPFSVDPLDTDIPAQWEKNRNGRVVRELIDFANAREMAIDVHLHYVGIDRTDDYRALTELTTPAGGNWPAAELLTSLEWSPMPTKAWWDANLDDEIRDYFFVEDPPGASDCEPEHDWEHLVANNPLGLKYLAESAGGYAGDFRMAGLLQELDLTYGFLHACYGGFGQMPHGSTLQKDPCNQYLGNNVIVADPDQYTIFALWLTYVEPENSGGDMWSDEVLNDLQNAAYPRRLHSSWTAPHSGHESCGCGQQ